MRALRVRLVGLGASLVLGITSLVGAGSALAENNVHAVCHNVDIATSGGTNRQSINIVGVATSDGAKWWPNWWPINSVLVIVDVATSGRTKATSGGTNWQSITIVQENSTVATGDAVVSGGTNVRCVAVATGD